MVSEADVQAKSDDELRDVWANQHEYTQEMVSCVKAEIERRHLDISDIHVPTTDEITRQAEVEADRSFVVVVVIGQSLLGFFLLLAAVAGIVECAKEEFRYPGQGPDIRLPLCGLALGIVLMAFAVGVWRERRWALFCGLVFYSIVTVWNVAVTIFNVIIIVASPASTTSAYGRLLMSGALIIVSGALALSFARLRKTSGSITAQPRANPTTR